MPAALEVIIAAAASLVTGIALSFFKLVLDRSTSKKRKKVSVLGRQVLIDVSDPLEQLLSEVAELKEKPRVFVSHTVANADIAKRLSRDLHNAGVQTWLGLEDLQPGDSISKSVSEALETAQYVVFLLPPSGELSDWQRRELSLAMNAERSRGRVIVLPARTGLAPVPSELADRLVVDLSANYSEALSRLLGRIKPIQSSATFEA